VCVAHGALAPSPALTPRPRALQVDILRDCTNDFVVRYLGSYTKDSTLWIVMELCEPGSVADAMRMLKTTLKEEQIRMVCASVLNSLFYLHSRKLIHRDVKGGNILLTRQGQAKLCDFGVSVQLNTLKSKRDTTIGAPLWMSPESLKGEAYDNKTDIWSLGITMVEMAQGQPPYADIHPMRAIFIIPTKDSPTLEDPSRWSAEMNDFLSKCVVKDPAGRASAEALLSHPFVAKAASELSASKGKSKTLMDLVGACLPLLDEFRAGQDKGGEDNTLAGGTLLAQNSATSLDATS
jgi:serine/threonine protein kinase